MALTESDRGPIIDALKKAHEAISAAEAKIAEAKAELYAILQKVLD